MRYYEEMKLKRLKSIDRSLKEISYVSKIMKLIIVKLGNN